MPASITLSHLSWSTPDGRSLFSGLDLSFGPERFGLVGRNGVGKTSLLELIAGNLQPRSGRVVVHGSLGRLRQAVQVRTDETVADLFGVTDALAILSRADSGHATAEELAAADWTLETRLAAALAGVGLPIGADTRLAALSGGQRTRLGLAALVFGKPDFLLLDEPTNNLDRDGRRAVIDLIAGWRGGAVVVSHDRELLEAMDVIVELTSLGASVYGGNWSRYRARKALELSAARHDLAEAEKQADEAGRKAQLAAERKARKDSAGRRARAKGDAPLLLLDAKKERSEKSSGAGARLAERQQAEAAQMLAKARERIEILQPLAVKLAPSGLPADKAVLRLDDVRFGYQPRRPILDGLSFTLAGPRRVAVTGPNGAGKTTLLGLITGRLRPWSGSVWVLAGSALLDQEVSLLEPAETIRDNFKRLNPQADENGCRAALARFMFRADAALQTAGSLSGGQMLRAGLACVLGGPTPPPLLILDEPTNHLDIEAIEAVEAGLRAYDGALLVVSHDESFLAAIGITQRLELSAPERFAEKPT